MATILLNVPDETLVSKVRKICKMLQGVTSVKVLKTEPSKTKVQDITKTAGYRQAMEDIKDGRVTQYDSLQCFYQEMGM